MTDSSAASATYATPGASCMPTLRTGKAATPSIATTLFANLLTAAATFATAGALTAPAHAAEPWPSRPIRIVVPYAPGNTGDITFRFIQPQLEKQFGVRFLIDNKSGASGNIGADEVVRAQPDGYTFLLGATNNFVTNQFLFRNMRFDPLKDLMPVALLSNAPSVMIVNSTLPVSTLKDFTEMARQSPSRLNYGSPGNGTPPHLAGELYSQLAKVQLTHVPYRGSPPAVAGLLGSEIQLYITAFSSVAGNVAGGKLKALAVASDQRLAILPDVPTTREQGLPDLLTGNWWGMAAPAGTDPAIIDKMSAAIKAALSDPAVRKQYADIGVTAVGSSPNEFGAQIAKEAVAWKQVIDRAQIQPE